MTKIDRAALSVFSAPDPDAGDGNGPGAVGDGLLEAAEAIQDDVVAIRRRIHRRPEIGLDLPLTQAVVLEELAKLGIEGTKGRALSSVVAVIEGGRPGPTVLLRGDMDALPLREDTGLDFASESPTGSCTPAATTPTSRCCSGRRVSSRNAGQTSRAA